MPPAPERLAQSPLVEALFELRFTPTVSTASDILVGLLYSRLKDEYGQVEALPLSSMPRAFRQSDERLKYQASHRLHGAARSIAIGDHVLAIGTTEYPGWTVFRDRISSLLKIAFETGIIGPIERCSFRYVNLLQVDTTNPLSLVNLRLEINSEVPPSRGLTLRVEKHLPDGVIVTIFTPDAKIGVPGRERHGFVVDVDCILTDAVALLVTDSTTILEEGHRRLKDAFFSLLTESTLAALQPVP